MKEYCTAGGKGKKADMYHINIIRRAIQLNFDENDYAVLIFSVHVGPTEEINVLYLPVEGTKNEST